MINMRYHVLPDWTETVRNEPILSATDTDIKATKLIMGHHIVACEGFICSILHLVKCLNYEDFNILLPPFDHYFPFNIDCRIAVELIVIA